MTRQKLLKLLMVLLIAAAIAAFFVFDLQLYFTLDNIKAQREGWKLFYAENRAFTLALFGGVYVMVTALSLPAATILTLLAGALFGFVSGLIMVSFASSIGATLAFLMARFLLRDSIQAKYGQHMTKINEGFEKEGAFYLFALRLVPVVPFFVINVLMALLPIKTSTFYWVSQLGMLAGTVAYVYAGTELGKVTSLSDIASPSLIAAFVALGLFPLIAKKALNFLRKKKI
ncbi:MAG: TVP38/TMEM64 family protein [Rickettsiales bacterium]|nr:TVP38/TMEM64 family protein [Rickettsiales bacterium]